MSFIGDTLGKITRPILGKPDQSQQESLMDSAVTAANAQAGIASDYYGATKPLQQQVLQRSMDFMKGNFDPTASAMFAPIKNTVEQQFGTAQNNLMSQLPQGGALFQGLANIQGQKAISLSDLIAKIVADEYQKAYAIGSGSPQAAASMFSGSGNTGTAGSSAVGQQMAAGDQLLSSLFDSLSKM